MNLRKAAEAALAELEKVTMRTRARDIAEDALRAALAESEPPYYPPMRKLVDFKCQCGRVYGFPDAMIPPRREPLSEEQLDSLCPSYDDPMRREMWKIGYRAAHGRIGEKS